MPLIDNLEGAAFEIQETKIERRLHGPSCVSGLRVSSVLYSNSESMNYPGEAAENETEDSGSVVLARKSRRLPESMVCSRPAADKSFTFHFSTSSRPSLLGHRLFGLKAADNSDIRKRAQDTWPIRVGGCLFLRDHFKWRRGRAYSGA